MEAKEQRSLKNILVMPGFQGGMVFIIILGGFVSTILNGVLYYYYVKDSYEMIFRFSTLPQEAIANRYEDLLTFGLVLCVAALLISLLIAGWGLIYTHRSAGAIYHLKLVFNKVQQGDLDARVHLRTKDQFHDVADSFNSMLDSIEQRSKPKDE